MNDNAVTAGKPGKLYTRKDFSSDQTIRWCPGCGDYAILAQLQRVMPQVCAELNIPKENIVFISGIGCSSRFPYYMDTYGFHTIHGRAPTFASGLRLSRPDLQVWVITGDGDGLSIGGNHLIHCLRRNIDVKILLFNNRIYGLTKGQYSPTSERGKITKSSPYGTLEQPLNPLSLALAAEGTFIARAIDTDGQRLRDILLQTAHHRGSAFVEILQNCNVFNDGAFKDFAGKAAMPDGVIHLEHGKPLLFGKDKTKALALRKAASGALQVETVHAGDVAADDILQHDQAAADTSLAFLLSRLEHPAHPVPIGVFRKVARPLYGDLLLAQIEQARQEKGAGNFLEHLYAGDLWTIKG